MNYRPLFAHRWKYLIRSGASSTRVLKAGIITFFSAYFAVALISTGLALPDLLAHIDPSLSAVPLVNRYLLPAALALLLTRFLMQRSHRIDFTPYLHLPIPRKRLVRFAQVVSLASLLNLFPLCFLLAFWLRSLAGEAYPSPGDLYWLAGAVLLVGFTHYTNMALRLLLSQHRKLFAGIVAVLMGLAGVDTLLGAGVLSGLSYLTFERLLQGSLLALGWIGALTLAMIGGSSYLLHRHLESGLAVKRPVRHYTPAVFSPKHSEILRLLLLDWVLILRNKRPARSLSMASFFAVVNVPVMLTPGTGASLLAGAVASCLSLVLVASSYGQFIFSWDSEHFDGLLSRPLNSRNLIWARLIILQLFCLGSFVVIFPFFWGLAPEHLLLLVSFLLYSVGIACPVLLLVALWNHKRIRLSKGALLNYEGISAQQFLVNIPIFLPPAALLSFVSELSAIFLIGGTGLFGMLLQPVLVRLFARLFLRRRYAMATGFRTYDD